MQPLRAALHALWAAGNFCHVSTVEAALCEEDRWRDVIRFLFFKGLHREGLVFLREMLKGGGVRREWEGEEGAEAVGRRKGEGEGEEVGGDSGGDNDGGDGTRGRRRDADVVESCFKEYVELLGQQPRQQPLVLEALTWRFEDDPTAALALLTSLRHPPPNALFILARYEALFEVPNRLLGTPHVAVTPPCLPLSPPLSPPVFPSTPRDLVLWLIRQVAPQLSASFLEDLLEQTAQAMGESGVGFSSLPSTLMFLPFTPMRSSLFPRSPTPPDLVLSLIRQVAPHPTASFLEHPLEQTAQAMGEGRGGSGLLSAFLPLCCCLVFLYPSPTRPGAFTNSSSRPSPQCLLPRASLIADRSSPPCSLPAPSGSYHFLSRPDLVLSLIRQVAPHLSASFLEHLLEQTAQAMGEGGGGEGVGEGELEGEEEQEGFGEGWRGSSDGGGGGSRRASGESGRRSSSSAVGSGGEGSGGVGSGQEVQDVGAAASQLQLDLVRLSLHRVKVELRQSAAATSAAGERSTVIGPERAKLAAVLQRIRLRLIPESLLPYLEAVLRAGSEQRRNSAVVKNLRRSENLQLREELANGRKRHVSITGDRLCAICRKRIGGSVFAVYPGGTLVHFVCFQHHQMQLPAAAGPCLERPFSHLHGIYSRRAKMATKVQRIMTQPINLIFRFLQSKSRIQIWLYQQKDTRIEGRIIGFDEYMNLVLEDAEEISMKKQTRKPLGRILLRGDNITLMMNTGK
ncbi:unnamed protein product [Closterium sp. Yama58-4]|nr:unnamed protein product [Closterium sp. Yama58-4]